MLQNIPVLFFSLSPKNKLPTKKIITLKSSSPNEPDINRQKQRLKRRDLKKRCGKIQKGLHEEEQGKRLKM